VGGATAFDRSHIGGSTVHTRTTQWLTAITTAILLLTAIATTASARNLSTSEQSFRSTFSSLEFEASVRLRCRVTLEGSFHTRTIAKTREALVGAITRAIVAHPCTNGEVWMDNGTEAQPLGTAPQRLPYHLTYASFTGALPSISAIGVVLQRASFVVQSTFLGLSCRGRYGNTTDRIAINLARDAGGGLTELRPVGRVTLVEQLGNAAVCPSELNFAGFGTVVNLSTGSRITVTLI